MVSAIAGEIRTVRALDREEAERHSLVVEAMDGGEPRLTATAAVLVTVADTNDNPPVVRQPLQTEITVREGQPPGEQQRRYAFKYYLPTSGRATISIILPMSIFLKHNFGKLTELKQENIFKISDI